MSSTRDRAGRVRPGRRDPAECRTGADVDDPGRSAGGVAQQVLRRAAADRAGARDAGGHRTLDDHQVPAPGHRVVAGLLRGPACRRHDRLVVVERDEPEQEIRGRRVAGPQERLGVTGAVLELEPHHDRRVHLGQCGGDARREPFRQGERRDHRRAEGQEPPPAHAGIVEPIGQRPRFGGRIWFDGTVGAPSVVRTHRHLRGAPGRTYASANVTPIRYPAESLFTRLTADKGQRSLDTE